MNQSFRKAVLFFVILIYALAVSACTAKEKNEVTILSIEPSTEIIAGIETEFVVEVDYKLVSIPEGKLSIAFNDGDEPNSFYDKGELQILSGEGNHTFKVKALPKKWENGLDFKAVVFIKSPDDQIIGSAEMLLEMSELENKISILEINTDTPLIEGKETTIKVTAQCDLLSYEEAKLRVAFNNGEEHGSFYESKTIPITKGQNSYTIDAPVTPKKWENGLDFKLVLFVIGENDEILFSCEKPLEVE